MQDFRVGTEHNGMKFIIRPLLCIDDAGNSLLSYKILFSTNRYKWIYRFKCYALVNDELRIFDFSENTRDNLPLSFFFMYSKKALIINVSVKDNMIKCTYETIEDDKYEFSSTPEKRKYITDLLTNTKLNLKLSLVKEKSNLSNKTIQLPDANGLLKSVKLEEIYKDE